MAEPPPLPTAAAGAATDAQAGERAPGDWTPAQLARLEAEWRKLRRTFAFHPNVRVIPLASEPPAEYRIEYRVRTLLVDDAGQLAYADDCAAHLSLPSQFPYAGPQVRALAGVFHPNVAGDDVVHFAPAWNPATSSLVDVVARVGEMLALQVYNPAAIHNPTAMDWVAQYPNLVPTDPNAVFLPEVAEDPAQRIARLGPAGLERHREELSRMAMAIIELAPGTERKDIREFGGRVSVELDVFTDPDVPDALRSEAAALDAWARSMAVSRSVWHEVRSLIAHARAATASADHVRKAQAGVQAAVAVVERLVDAEPSPQEPKDTVARLPDVVTLDPVVVRLRGAARELEKRVAELRAGIDGMSGPPLAPAGEPESLVHERTSSAVTTASAEADAARRTAFAALESAEPVLARARLELAALDVIAAWAAFVDLIRRGGDMFTRIEFYGAAGVQAYFMHASGGRFGPYQFEERIDVGTAVLVVRSQGPGSLEVFDARSVGLLGKGAASVQFKLPDAERRVHDAEVRATEHIEEVRVHLDYLVKTAREQLEILIGIGNGNGGGGGGGAGRAGEAPSWAGRFVRALTGADPLHVAADMHRLASHRWTALLADLDELAPFKERLATYHLVERHAEFVPAVLAAATKAQASKQEADERLAFIAARSSRDMDTGAVLVASQFADEYARRIAQRERAEKDLAKVRKLVSVVTAELQARLHDKRLLGRAGFPKLRVLAMPTMPDALGVTEAGLSDAHIQSRFTELRRLLGTPGA